MKTNDVQNAGKRKFLKQAAVATGAITASLAMPNLARGALPKVVVIGGGVGGATTARYLAKSGGIDVTVIEPNRAYTTCFFSNLFLGGIRSYESITHSYETLKRDYGIKFAHSMAYGADPKAKTVTLAQGGTVNYDRLVVSPGIDFDYEAYEGYSEEASWELPHSYQAGPQTTLLKRQLQAMEDGGTFLMVAPPNPYRCPPGPYERVSMIAYYLSQHKPKSKILILDPKDKFSKQGLFQEAWAKYYPDMIEWLPNELIGDITSIDVANKTVTAGDEVFSADVINVIPPQMAGKIAQTVGLTNESGWCPIRSAESFESAMVDGVHVLGDASINGAMPKSGFSANSQAKNVAMMIAHELVDGAKFPARLRNTCWSLVNNEDAVKVGANYDIDGSKTVAKDKFISKTGEDEGVRMQTRMEAFGWYDAISKDVFG